MERKIGEIFEYNGEWYQCVKGDCCRNCDFYDKFKDDICFSINNCSLSHRSDKKSVIFKKLEKVGEPFTGKVHVQLQRYKIYTEPIMNSTENVGYINEDNTIVIEIKPTKENMEENKLNLKPFDIQKAKEGKPVCTRDGRKARIICFDVKGNFPMAVAVEVEKDIEIIYTFHLNGRADPKGNRNNGLDLMMLPEKKEGWVNVYKGGLLDTKSYNTKKEAFDKASPEDYVDTVKINWEE